MEPRWQIDARGTPTMGGTLILFALTISTIMWMDFSNLYLWLLLFITLGFGIIGFIDDYLKLSKFSYKGLSGKIKILLQSLVSLIFFLLISLSEESNTYLFFQFLKISL